jgi:hypothetical protein
MKLRALRRHDIFCLTGPVRERTTAESVLAIDVGVNPILCTGV